MKFMRETYEPNHVLMYEAILMFIQVYPDCWKYIDIPISMITNIKRLIKSSPLVSLQFLMPILGSIPSNEISIHAGIIEKDLYKKKSKKSKNNDNNSNNNDDDNENKSTVLSIIELIDSIIRMIEDDILPSGIHHHHHHYHYHYRHYHHYHYHHHHHYYYQN